MSGTYVATDSSRLKFDASASPNVIYMPDGSRYVLNSSGAQYLDRNGNTLTYTSKQWMDTLAQPDRLGQDEQRALVAAPGVQFDPRLAPDQTGGHPAGHWR